MLSKNYPGLDLSFILTEDFKQKNPGLKEDIISHLRSSRISSDNQHNVSNRILIDKEDPLYQLFHSKRGAYEPGETRRSSALEAARILFDELNKVTSTPKGATAGAGAPATPSAWGFRLFSPTRAAAGTTASAGPKPAPGTGENPTKL